MKKTKLLSIIFSIAFLALTINLFSTVAMAAPQTLTILGASGTPGDTDPYTEFTLDDGKTWSHAYLYGSHPWGFVPGTNSWLNIGPSGTDYGINQAILYRVRFNVPADSINPQLTFDVKADNYAAIWLNGAHVKDIVGEGGTTADATVNGAVLSGLNEIKLLVTDTGGWAGFNYKITLNVDAPTPPTLIDTIAPTASVSYSKVNPTNQDVVATIVPSNPVTITNNNGSTSHTFSENGSFTFEFMDAQGKLGSAVATVANIDKVVPIATVAYNTTVPTNQDVIATITPSEDVTITNNGGLNSYTFTQNGSFTFNFVDAAGNMGSIAATVTNIDKTATTTADNAPTGWVNTDVTVQLTANDGGSGVASTNYTVDGGEQQTGTSVVLTTEGVHTIAYWSVDTVGNIEAKHTATVKIDKTAPVSGASVNPTTPTGNNGWYSSAVTLSLSAMDSLSGVTQTVYQVNNGVWGTYNGSIPAFSDGVYKVNYGSTDNAGNVEQIKTVEFKIDKTAPILTVQLDKSVIAPLDDEKMAVIHATLNASDATSGVASVILTSITSNKIVKGQEKENPKKVDFLAKLGTSATSFSVLAKEGYIYTITYTITDNAGNKSTVVSTVSVKKPKENDDGNKGNQQGNNGDSRKGNDSSKKGE